MSQNGPDLLNSRSRMSRNLHVHNAQGWMTRSVSPFVQDLSDFPEITRNRHDPTRSVELYAVRSKPRERSQLGSRYKHEFIRTRTSYDGRSQVETVAGQTSVAINFNRRLAGAGVVLDLLLIPLLLSARLHPCLPVGAEIPDSPNKLLSPLQSRLIDNG